MTQAVVLRGLPLCYREEEFNIPGVLWYHQTHTGQYLIIKGLTYKPHSKE